MKSITDSVHRGFAELAVYDNADELAVDFCVEDGCESDGELHRF